MFCEKCGAQIADDALFCNACGSKVDNAENEVSHDLPGEDAKSVITEVRTEEIPNGIDISSEFNAEEPKRKKKISKKIVAGIVGAAILTVGAFGLFFKNALFFAVAPEKYTGNLIADTLEGMAEEAEKIDENIMGFKPSIDDAYTAGAKVEVTEDYEQGMSAVVDYKAANNPGSSEMLINADVSAKNQGQEINGNLQGFWNDEKIGLAVSDVKLDGKDVLPKNVTDKYFVVSSKNFGDEFMDSIFADAANLGLEYSDIDTIDISGLDLSYSNIMNMIKGEELKPLRKELKKEFLDFLDECDISDRKSVKFRFDDDKVRAKKITVTVDAEDLVDFAIGALQAISRDKYIKEQLGDEAVGYLDLAIDSLKEERSDVPEYEFDIDFIEYDGRIVEVSAEIDGAGFVLSSTDKEYALNGMKVELLQGGSTSMEAEYKSNWASEKNKIFIEASASQNGSVMGKAKAELDFGKEKFAASAEIPGVDKYSISGKCSKKDGFMISVEDIRIPQSGRIQTNSMDYDEWFNKEYRDSESKNSSYYYDNENYDDLWDIYYDQFWGDYDSYADWYDAMGSNYDENYKTYDEWLSSEIYNSSETREDYEYETGEYKDVDYDIVINITCTLKKGVDFKIKDRKHVNIFKMTEEEIEELGESFENIDESGSADADEPAFAGIGKADGYFE